MNNDPLYALVYCYLEAVWSRDTPAVENLFEMLCLAVDRDDPPVALSEET